MPLIVFKNQVGPTFAVTRTLPISVPSLGVWKELPGHRTEWKLVSRPLMNSAIFTHSRLIVGSCLVCKFCTSKVKVARSPAGVKTRLLSAVVAFFNLLKFEKILLSIFFYFGKHLIYSKLPFLRYGPIWSVLFVWSFRCA